MMKLKKSFLEVFFLSLKGTEGILNLADGRIRDAHLDKISEPLNVFYKDRVKIYEKFCDKNEDGTPKMNEENAYSFAPEVQGELLPELGILAAEEVELEIDPKIKEFIEKSEYKPKIGESAIIDEILTKI